MTKTIYLILVLLMISVSSRSQTKAEKEVLTTLETLRKGIVDADRGLLSSVAADKLVYGHSSGKVQNKTEFIEEIVSKIPFDYTSVDFGEQTVTVSGNVAVVRHIYSADAVGNGTNTHIRIGNMLVFQKQRGGWKLLARQAYKL